MTPEDQEILLMRARAGDIESLVTLLEVVGHDVRMRVASKVNPAWRALLDEDDVMQTTYLEAVTRFDRFTSGGAREFAAWLARLAENNLIDGIRALEAAKRPDPSKRVSGKRTAEDSMSSLVTVLGVTLTTPSIHAARGEAGDFITKALEALPEDYRRVIQLYDLGESLRPKWRQSSIAAKVQSTCSGLVLTSSYAMFWDGKAGSFPLAGEV